MKTYSLPSTETLDAFKQAFPIEDIWFFETENANQCGLSTAKNILLFVSEETDAFETEDQARKILAGNDKDVSVHVFRQSAMYQLPRPLLVKMAFTSGHSVFCK